MNGDIGVKDQGIGVKVKGGGAPMMGGRQPTRLPTPGMCFYHQQIPATYVCNKCGRAICHTCGQRFGPLVFCPQCNPYPGGPPPMYQAPPPPPPPQSNMAPAGGALILIAGILGLIGGIFLFGIGGFGYDYYYDDVWVVYLAIMLIEIIFSVIALIGSIFAINKSNFAIAIMGGIFGLFTVGFIFSLIGLILVAVSRKEFPR